MDNTVVLQMAIASAVSFGLQKLKEWKGFPWITSETQTINHAISSLLAVLTGFGIFTTWDHTAGTLTIVGLTSANLLHCGTKIFEQFFLQKLVYRSAIAPPLPGVLQPKPLPDGASPVAILDPSGQLSGNTAVVEDVTPKATKSKGKSA